MVDVIDLGPNAIEIGGGGLGKGEEGGKKEIDAVVE